MEVPIQRSGTNKAMYLSRKAAGALDCLCSNSLCLCFYLFSSPESVHSAKTIRPRIVKFHDPNTHYSSEPKKQEMYALLENGNPISQEQVFVIFSGTALSELCHLLYVSFLGFTNVTIFLPLSGKPCVQQLLSVTQGHLITEKITRDQL